MELDDGCEQENTRNIQLDIGLARKNKIEFNTGMEIIFDLFKF